MQDPFLEKYTKLVEIEKSGKLSITNNIATRKVICFDDDDIIRTELADLR